MQLDLFREIVVDNFAGGGGASTGIEEATGLSVDIAINHDPAAIAMHKLNHPDTEHYCEDAREGGRKSIPHVVFMTECDLIKSDKGYVLHYLKTL